MLRRAMGKKIKAEMDNQRIRFRQGAGPNGVSEALADQIFDLLAKFANYGFNKSHAAAYAWVSYQTAYLKQHFPHEFYAASMTLDMAQTDKLSDFRREAGKKGIEVVPPCVNRSDVVFSVREDRIHYGLSAVKGVGRAMAEHIVAVRGDEPFKDLGDFARRVIRASSTSARWKPSSMPGPSMRSFPPRDRLCGHRCGDWHGPGVDRRAVRGAVEHVRQRGARALSACRPGCPPGVRPSGRIGNSPPSASTSRPIRSMPMPISSKSSACSVGPISSGR